MNNIEIEIQVQLENAAPLVAFLQKNAVKKGSYHQIDEYFTLAHRDFISVRPVVEWLRLRDSSGECSITYKYWHQSSPGITSHCDEYETEIKDIEQARLIFKALDFTLVTTVDKTREIYHYDDFEIALDQVKGLGDFVEIEHKGDGKGEDATEITAKMVKFLKDLQVGKIYRNHVGYAFRTLSKEDVLLEEL